MPHWASPTLRLPTGRGLVWLFSVTMALPGVLLAFLGARALYQERRLAEQQARERLERATDRTVRELEQELARWQLALEQARRDPRLDRLPLPPGAGVDSDEGRGAAVFVAREGDSLRAVPPGELLYAPEPAPAALQQSGPRAAPLAEAEAAEIRDKDFQRAITLYRRLLTTASPADRASLTHRLARTHRKAGLNDAALRLFHELEGSSSRIGGVPAVLLAQYEICAIRAEQGSAADLATSALELYQGLVAGRSPIEKSRYLFYSESARGWLEAAAPGSPELRLLRATEERKLSMTRAVELMVEVPRRVVPTEAGEHLAFWTASPFTALVLSPSFLQVRFWPQVFAAASADDLEATLVVPGRASADSAPPGQPRLVASRSLADLGLPWRLEVRPRQPERLSADLARREKLYLAMLLLVVALVGFGGYLTLRTVRKEMEVARLKSEFVSAVSHEFRSPVTGIRQLAEILLRGQPSEERRRHYYELIGQESDRLARLVENVLDFSRMEEGRREYRLEPLEAGPWLRAAAEEFRAEVAERGYSLAASLPERPSWLRADREALSSALHNLLDNAVKYSPSCRTVWLEAEASGDWLTIRVRDRGLGIAEEDRKHVFEKFYRGSIGAATPVKGAGLGLSLVRHIVVAHGGSVTCESHPGEGSTFTIVLPAVAGPSPESGA
jgi:signal transduction histidine kinase